MIEWFDALAWWEMLGVIAVTWIVFATVWGYFWVD